MNMRFAAWPAPGARIDRFALRAFGLAVCLTVCPAACGNDEPREVRPDVGADDAGAVADMVEPDVIERVPERREERPVFRLGDNRLLAHVRARGGLFIDAGSAGFAKYVRFAMPSLRWQLGRKRDGVRAAVAEKLASIEVPLSPGEARRFARLTMRVHSPRGGRMGVKINGRSAGEPARLSLVPGWQTVTVSVAGNRLVPGENFIAFEFGRSRGAPALAWLHLGPADPQHSPVARDQKADRDDIVPNEDNSAPNDDVTGGVAGAMGYVEDGDRFTLERGSGLTYYIYVPDSGELVADVTGGDDRDAGGCRMDVRARSERSATPAQPAETAPPAEKALPAEGAVEQTPRAEGSLPVEVRGVLAGPGSSVTLDALAREVVRLDLVAAGCARVHLANARITVAGAARPVFGRSGPRPRHIVLWVMDTLRADRVRPFQPDARAEVPSFERLAETGTVFRQYWVQGNESQTSHSSVWTSLYPVNHNVRTAGNGGTWKLSRKFDRIPALLKEAGFTTIGITANGYVTKYGGYGRGFAVWRNLMREGAAKNGNVPAPVIYDLGVQYMAEHYRSGPVLLFLGTIDTHKPWIGRDPWLSRYDPKPYSGVHERAAWPVNLGMTIGSMECTQVPEPRDLERINAIYDSDVSYQDRELGRLVEQLDEWGILSETMIIVTADHGEELWEDGRCGHGASLRETLVRVPLLIHYPPLFPGRVVEEGAEGVDLMPTILDALDLDPVDDAQGASLIPLAQGATGGYPRPSYASQYEYAHAMRLANWKARVGRSGVPTLYDLAADPDEKQNLVADRPIARRFMTDAMSLFLVYRARWKKQIWGVASNMTAQAVRDLEGGDSEDQGKNP